MSMEKRANILHIAIDNDQFRKELADDRQFVTHLNVCSLLNTNHDEKFIMKSYKELKVQNVTSNTTKLKLINEVQTMMNISPLCIDDINNDVVIPEEKKEIIKKVFRINDVSLISMYRNLVPGIVKASRVMVDGVRERKHEIDSDVIKHHLDLLHHRNSKFNGIAANTINYFGYAPPKPKKIF